ncbi:rhomboid family intramembrane serine protease [Chelativorans sp. AA-79]|uniref:rhomboid family intramembrane serine protease n=1 Tax=Chelativorans sp. AA-79 TaxID=3028735 RepID=UPI0023F6B47D|nr:rhomboid family intramembrane serine protease [Chelativorans sp. AA-79]WEX10104.1 rhomboid family intramembrane serine protease [Chelativorans sp. AA-79]
MFIPLHDANRLRYIKHQYMTFSIIALNIFIWALTSLSGVESMQAAVLGLGYIPSVVHDLAVLPPELELVPAPLTYVTYAFLHGDIFHLGGNMLFLWVFGDNVEDALGHFRYLLFYLVCTIAAAAFHGMTVPDSQAPLIGASGAVAGVIAAYLILHPRVKLWVLAFARIPLRLPAYIVLLLWIGTQFLMFVIDRENQISWSAHIGGIIAGAVLVFPMRRRGVPLFDRPVVVPEAVKVK